MFDDVEVPVSTEFARHKTLWRNHFLADLFKFGSCLTLSTLLAGEGNNFFLEDLDVHRREIRRSQPNFSKKKKLLDQKSYVQICLYHVTKKQPISTRRYVSFSQQPRNTSFNSVLQSNV